jgi:serpin B
LGTGDLTVDDVGRRSARYLQHVRNRTDVTLKIANAAWWNPKFEESPEYRARVLRDYDATIERRDLSTRDFVDVFNAWAKEKTEGMIPKVIETPLPDTTVFLLANATYFHGLWLLPFNSTKTQQRDFVLRDGSLRSVPMMEQVATVSYLVRPGYRVARLPYRTGKTAMYVVLPDSGAKIDPSVLPFIGSSTADSVAHAPMSQLRIVLPRFTGSHTEDLLKTMQSLGVRALFECGIADLKGMLRDNKHELCVGMAAQSARIEVTEEGTKAAAVTAVVGITTTSMPPPPIPFIVNRPFFFVVRDEVYGVDLFVGYVAVPDSR